jgi:NADH dehydrogenase
VAGAIAEMIRTSLATEYPALAGKASVRLVNHGHELLSAFSPKAHEYAAKVLTRDGVQLMLGLRVTEVGPGHVVLSDGSTIRTRCIVWGGGLKAADIATAAGLPQGHGGRIDVRPDFTLDGVPGIHVIGDIANIPDSDGRAFPQLGSVAQQSGSWAAKNILAELDGTPLRSFHYLDKGIMAMIGRGAAVAEVGKDHHGLHGAIAFAGWLGVHAALMSGVHNRVDAFVQWAEDYLGSTHGPYTLDRSDTARIDWHDDPLDAKRSTAASPAAVGSA